MNYKMTLQPEAETKPIIEVKNIGKEYRIGAKEKYVTLRDAIVNLFKFGKQKTKPKFWALKNLNLEIRQGEVLGIIGRNGAGKSTLLKLISKITLPTTGQITIRGRVASLLEVGTGFNPELTGRENIYLNGAILGMTRREINGKFTEIVEFAEIDQFLDTPVKHYSSGMYVRLAFAVAAHLNPEILLIDEVLAVGDARFQKKCLGKMEEISKGGRTVIFISHNMQSIRKLCTRAVLLDIGEKIIEGDVASVISQYENRGTNEKTQRILGEDAPKSNWVEMLEVGIRSNGQEVIGIPSTEKPLQIYVRFKVLSEVPIGSKLTLADEDGQNILISFSNHNLSWHLKKRPVGIYESTCEIPANLLRKGKYSATILLFKGSYEEGLEGRDILYFSIEDGGYIQGDFPGIMPTGIIQPLLKWTSSKKHDE